MVFLIALSLRLLKLHRHYGSLSLLHHFFKLQVHQALHNGTTPITFNMHTDIYLDGASFSLYLLTKLSRLLGVTRHR
jgi:hypothetical protein